MPTASIIPDEIPVIHSVRPDVGLEYLTVNCPNGWDDVKKLTRKVLTFEGRRFTWQAWDSDRNVCWFSAPLGASAATAKVGARRATDV
jgi:hypothetical protein